jgi:protein CpxP
MKLTSLALAGALALTGVAAASAQPAPNAAPDAAQRHWQRPDPAQMAEKHAQHLRDALQLRPDQEPALRALISASTPPAGLRDRARGERGERSNLTTPQRLDRMQARMAERQQHFAQRADATRRFYAQLSPTQQRAFDTLHEGHGHRGGHDHGGAGRGHNFG